MAAAPPDLCTVCDKPASLRCSKCRASSYCSTRCQALLWPTHKILCGRDPDMFYLPPLGQADLARLERFKGEDYAGYDEPFSAFVSVYLGIAWSTFLALVTSVDGLAGDNSPESLGCRNLMIVVARRHLYNVTRSRDPGLRIVDLPIWDTFSDAAENYVNRCINLKAQEAAPWTVAEPWRALNGLLRQDLVRHTLFFKQRQCQADILQEELGRLSILSFRRAIVEARRADLPQLAKDEIAAAFKECVENTLKMWDHYAER